MALFIEEREFNDYKEFVTEIGHGIRTFYTRERKN